MVPVGGYGFERGDVLLSVQLVLTREEQRADPPRIVPSPGIAASREAGGWLPTGWGTQGASVVPLDPMGRPRLADGGPASASIHSSTGGARPQELGLIDPSTGAGSFRALRRDLQSEMARAPAGTGEPAVVALEVRPAAEIRRRDGDEAAERLLRAVVEVVPFMLRGRDRVYRTGPDELALLMPLTDVEGMEAALARLLEMVPRSIAERKLGSVRLVPRRVRMASPRAASAGR
jgi:GGDEF domain-containing protein